MNYSAKDKFVTGCNWLMAGTALAFSVYVFVQLLSLPPQSPVVLRTTGPAPVAATTAVAAPSPARQLGNTVAQPNVNPGGVPVTTSAAPSTTIVAAPNRPAGAASPGATDKAGVWEHPSSRAPSTPIPTMNQHLMPPEMRDFGPETPPARRP